MSKHIIRYAVGELAVAVDALRDTLAAAAEPELVTRYANPQKWNSLRMAIVGMCTGRSQAQPVGVGSAVAAARHRVSRRDRATTGKATAQSVAHVFICGRCL